jgi:decaprenyl-phosphate phosphoribosyltransferase
MAGPAAFLRLARPKQWVKNVLVVAAPGAAGVLFHPGDLARTAAAFAAFSAAASGTYAWNDALDVEADRAHPTKCRRPVASGEISVRSAQVFGTVLLLAGVGGGFAVTRSLGVTVLSYAVLTVAYSARLKHEPVLDLAAVAAGFVLRAVGGGAAVNARISTWFLIVAAAGSLFIVTGKRSAEVTLLGDDSAGHRRALAGYTDAYLRYVRSVATSVAVLAYCLWAFEFSKSVGEPVWFELSIVPFVLGLLRYALLLDQGEGGAPEDLLLADPVLLSIGVAWAVTFAAAVYFS